MLARQVLFTGKEKVELATFDIDSPKRDQVLIETLFSAISPGTERAMLLAQPNTATAERGFPFQPGYSNVGRVAAIGGDVKNFREGDLVATMQTHASHILLPDTLGSAEPPERYRSDFKSPLTPGVSVPQLHHIWRIPSGVRGDALNRWRHSVSGSSAREAYASRALSWAKQCW